MSSKNKSFQLPSSPVHPGSKAGIPGISRNSEMNSPMRRSFTGNPFVKPSIVAGSRGLYPNTPANSPSDYAVRKSISRESFASLRDFEDKENGKDPNLKPGRVRSPAASKGTKNFMSPTISAASKIAPSPKKKVLIEKSEPARTSASTLNVKSPRSVSFADFVEEIISKPEMEVYDKDTGTYHDAKVYKKETDDCHDVKVYEKETDFCRDVTVADVEKEVADEFKLSSNSVESESGLYSISSPSFHKGVQPPDTVVVDGDFSDDHASSEINDSPISGPNLAPLDADPSMPPYDPRNNYLSPRPQFLHYKPNPRIGYYLNRDGRRDGEGIFSECSSDSETSSEDSQVESEDAVEAVEDVDVQCSDLNVTAKLESKSCFFTRFRFITLLLVGLVAFSSFAVNNYPVTQPSAFEDSSLSKLYIPPEMSEFARETINGITQNFRQWWQNTIVEVSQLILKFKSKHAKGLLLYSNLTVDDYAGFSHRADTVDDYAGFSHRADTIEPINESNVVEQIIENHSSIHVELIRNDDSDYDEQLHQEVVACDYTDQISEEHSTRELEEQQVTGTGLNSYDIPAYDDHIYKLSGVRDNHDDISEGSSGNINLSLQEGVIEVSNAELKKPESVKDVQTNLDISLKDASADLFIQTEVFEPLEQHVENDWGSPQVVCTEVEPERLELEGSDAYSELLEESLKLEASNAHLEASEKEDVSYETLDDKRLPQRYLLVASFLVMSLTAIAFLYMKKGKIAASCAVLAPAVPKKFEISPTEEHTFYERPSWNQPTEVDIAGGSYPSEMSSFQNNGSGGASEAQSQGRRRPRKNFRRESLASSDFSLGDSPSFGSFTTYEKFSCKLGEEEVITPVRRSSRIRKQVTSP